MSNIPTNWHNCATCSHWCGHAKPNFFCTFVEVDTNEKALCAGGGFRNCNMSAMASCQDWERRFG